MQFDPKKNTYKPLMKYMKGKSCLVYDPVSTVRQTVIRLMQLFEIPGRDIFRDAKDYEQVKDLIIEQKPHFVFINTKIDESKGIELFKLFQKQRPNKRDGGFYLMSEDNSLSDAAMILDHDLDGYIAQPYTFDSILEIFCNSLFKKTKKDKNLISLEKAKAHLIMEEYEEAHLEFENGESIGKVSADHAFFKGLNFYQLGEDDMACESLITGLKVLPTHYRCLSTLVNIHFTNGAYEKAYKHMVMILQNYPLNPDQIPMLTKISISNQKYEDIFKYAEIFIELPNKNPTIQKYLVAGLVLCGKFMLMNDDPKKATRVFLDAAKLSNGRKEVLLQIIIALSEVKLFDHAVNILTKYTSKDMATEDFMHLQLEVLIRQDKPSMIFKSWAQIKSEGPINNPRLYEIILEASVQAKLGETQVESLLDDASSSFPEKLQDFKRIIAA